MPPNGSVSWSHAVASSSEDDVDSLPSGIAGHEHHPYWHVTPSALYDIEVNIHDAAGVRCAE
jgi:hypothetical protein